MTEKTAELHVVYGPLGSGKIAKLKRIVPKTGHIVHLEDASRITRIDSVVSLIATLAGPRPDALLFAEIGVSETNGHDALIADALAEGIPVYCALHCPSDAGIVAPRARLASILRHHPLPADTIVHFYPVSDRPAESIAWASQGTTTRDAIVSTDIGALLRKRPEVIIVHEARDPVAAQRLRAQLEADHPGAEIHYHPAEPTE